MCPSLLTSRAPSCDNGTTYNPKEAHVAWKRPTHVLEAVRLTVHIPQPGPDQEWRLEMLGTSPGSRASLWSRSLAWAPHEVDHGLQVCDEINWSLHSILADRPSSPFWLDRSLRGLPVGVQLELPW